MANLFSGVWVDIRTAIQSAWPEVTIIYRAPQMRKVNWVNLIEAFDKNTSSAITSIYGVQAGLAPPWCIVDIPQVEQNEDWGMHNMVYTPEITVFYVGRDNSQPPGFSTLLAYLEERVEALRNTLLKPAAAFNSLQVLEMFSPNVSETNDVNQSLLDSNMPYLSGSLRFLSCFGEIIPLS